MKKKENNMRSNKTLVIPEVGAQLIKELTNLFSKESYDKYVIMYTVSRALHIALAQLTLLGRKVVGLDRSWQLQSLYPIVYSRSGYGAEY